MVFVLSCVGKPTCSPGASFLNLHTPKVSKRCIVDSWDFFAETRDGVWPNPRQSKTMVFTNLNQQKVTPTILPIFVGEQFPWIFLGEENNQHPLKGWGSPPCLWDTVAACGPPTSMISPYPKEQRWDPPMVERVNKAVWIARGVYIGPPKWRQAFGGEIGYLGQMKSITGYLVGPNPSSPCCDSFLGPNLGSGRCFGHPNSRSWMLITDIISTAPNKYPMESM